MALVLAVALVGSLVVPTPAGAADLDSAFAGESAFLTLTPGQSGTFTVFFQNTGTLSWMRGTATQVDLAACRSDQTTCDSREPRVAALDPGTWLSATRYATHSQATVAPGAIGTFTYGVRVPASQTAGTYRFHGDLVASTTGRLIHPEGYYQDVTVPAAACVPGIVTATPTFSGVQVGREHVQSISVTCTDGRTPAANIPVSASVPSENIAGNPTLTLSAVTDAQGIATVRWSRSNPSTERVTITPVGYPSVIGSATVRWVVPELVISCAPTTAESLGGNTSRVHTITAKAPLTGAAYSGSVAVTVASFLGYPSSLTINNVSAIDKSVGSTIVTLSTTTGSASFAVSGTRGTIQPRVFLDENSSGTLDTTEFSADCGATTYGAT
jgi:hypothetical protein